MELLISGINLIDKAGIELLAIKFVIDFVVISILIFGVYYPGNKKSQYLFNFFIFNILIFFVSSLLSSVKLKTGFAFGLFAIFSILRFRTEPIPAKDMTFMFISIIVATINSTITADISFAEVMFANIIIILMTFSMEKLWLRRYKPVKKIEFEMIELIHQSRRSELIEELEKRTGSKVSEVEVESINFLRDTAVLKVYME